MGFLNHQEYGLVWFCSPEVWVRVSGWVRSNDVRSGFLPEMDDFGGTPKRITFAWKHLCTLMFFRNNPKDAVEDSQYPNHFVGSPCVVLSGCGMSQLFVTPTPFKTDHAPLVQLQSIYIYMYIYIYIRTLQIQRQVPKGIFRLNPYPRRLQSPKHWRQGIAIRAEVLHMFDQLPAPLNLRLTPRLGGSLL